MQNLQIRKEFPLRTFWKYYGFTTFVTVLVGVLVGIFMGPLAAGIYTVLCVLEWSVSFDNAVVNAKVLKKMSHFWQRMFIVIGIPIAVFGMRFVFPVAVVMLAAGLGFTDVVTLALNDPDAYQAHMETAHGQIAVFGGVYLLMIFLDWLFEEREITWLPFEKMLAKAGKLDSFSVIIALIFTVVIASMAHGHEQFELAIAGIVSVVLYKTITNIGSIFDQEDDAMDNAYIRTGMAAFGLFIYLEMQDAAFSLDGVSGAFAVTNLIILIAAGLGVGALWVRSMTIHLVEEDKLTEFRFLEHGAHWAIGVLAVFLLLETQISIPDFVTGLFGAFFVATATYHSYRLNRRDKREESQASPETTQALRAPALSGAADDPLNK